MKTRLSLLAALLLIFSACSVPTTPQPVETVIPTSETVSMPGPSLPPVQAEPSPVNGNNPDMTTYTDNLAGFSFEYPADWFIESSALVGAQQSFAYTISIATLDLRNPPTPSTKDGYALPEGATKIDVTVVKQPVTLEEAVIQQSENESDSPILARKDVTLAGGLPGVILDVEGFARPTRTLITILNGNVVYVSGYGNLENFESIALTLRAK